MERSNGMKSFRVGTMCQLIEIICHSTQLANEVCLLYGQSFNDISFIKNFLTNSLIVTPALLALPLSV